MLEELCRRLQTLLQMQRSSLASGRAALPAHSCCAALRRRQCAAEPALQRCESRHKRCRQWRTHLVFCLIFLLRLSPLSRHLLRQDILVPELKEDVAKDGHVHAAPGGGRPGKEAFSGGVLLERQQQLELIVVAVQELAQRGRPRGERLAEPCP